MRRKFKIGIAVILVLLCASLLTVYLVKSTPPHGMSPEETVQFYFDAWNKKDCIKQNLLIKSTAEKSWLPDFELNSVKLIECEERRDSGEKHEQWYDESAYDFTRVWAKFEEDRADFGTHTYTWHFDLIREKQSSDWKIVMYGAG